MARDDKFGPYSLDARSFSRAFEEEVHTFDSPSNKYKGCAEPAKQWDPV